jgi:hypothetical protein
METDFLPEIVYQKLPKILLELTEPFSGREKDVVLLSSLGVLSAALPKVYGNYDGNKYSSNLYLLIVAPAASGKGVMNKSKVLIEKIHQTILDISLENIAECESEKKSKKDLSIKCPELEVKLIPGNVSSSKIYKHLKNAAHGILIFETEADTISVMLKQDWGNFSDIMRKAFHHETISISRETDDKFIEVRYPQLSLVISGTPNQVKPLINSKENGLFSRFIFYVFNDVMGWKDVSPKGIKIDYNAIFSSVSIEISNLYQKLENNISNVEITLSDSQWEQFNRDMSYITELFIKQNRSDVLSIIKRQGLILFRICMILTIIRNKDLETFQDNIVCDDADYLIAFEIMKIIIDHSMHASNLLQDGKIELTVRETQFLASMRKKFTRADAVLYAEQINIPTRTLDYMLKKLTESKFLSKPSNGIYEQIGK